MESVEVVFSGRQSSYSIVCQNCNRKKILYHDQLQHLSHTVKAKCTCGAIFDLVFERRRFYRKKVQLDAQLMDLKSGEKLDDITVTTLSVGGIGFVSQLDDIDVGARYRVTFYLDNASQAYVAEDLVIRNKNNGTCGAEFLRQEVYNFDLDFYLMPITVVD